jgi:hypothetical protein
MSSFAIFILAPLCLLGDSPWNFHLETLLFWLPTQNLACSTRVAPCIGSEQYATVRQDFIRGRFVQLFHLVTLNEPLATCRIGYPRRDISESLDALTNFEEPQVTSKTYYLSNSS